MDVKVRLYDKPFKKAVVSVGEGQQKLSYSIVDPSVSDAAWSRLMAEGITPEMFDREVAGETEEVGRFRERIASVVSILRSSIGLLGRNNSHSASGMEEPFLDYAGRIIEAEDGESRRTKYRTAISAFGKYLFEIGKEKLLCSNLSGDMVRGFNHSLKSRGLKESTIAFYNRILAAIYNRAIKDGVTVDNGPFAEVATQVRTVACSVNSKTDGVS